MKVYQIFIDGAAGYEKVKPEDFADEITDMYKFEHDKNIPQPKLDNMLGNIRDLEVGNYVEFPKENLKFYCYERYE